MHESPDRAVRDDMSLESETLSVESETLSLALESLPSESLPSAYKAAQRGKMMLSQYCRFQYRCRQHATGWWPACPGGQSHNQGWRNKHRCRWWYLRSTIPWHHSDYRPRFPGSFWPSLLSGCVNVSQIISKFPIHYLYRMEHTNTIFWIDIETTNMFHFADI